MPDVELGASGAKIVAERMEGGEEKGWGWSVCDEV